MININYTSAECFAGIGAWGKALDRVTKRYGDTHELKYYFEIDKYASNAFSTIHNVSEELNKWDITQDVKVEPVDIFFYSPPCQTFSIAGKKEGRTVAKGNLFDSALKYLKASNPKFAIMENVANLAQQFKDDFRDMIKDLEAAGYVNYNKVLNSKNYGIPHNRERIFVVSIRKDLYEQGIRFEWPVEIKFKKTLDEITYDLTENKFMLNKEDLEKVLKDKNDIEKINTYADFRYDEGLRIRKNDISPCLVASSKPKDISGIPLKIVKDISKYKGYVIFRFSPLICFRLQGFDDEDYYKAVQAYENKWKPGASDRQMYIRAGNSITVNVIEEILENLLYQRKQEVQMTLF